MKIKLKNKEWISLLISLNAILMILANVFLQDEGFTFIHYGIAVFIVIVNISYYFIPKLYIPLSYIIGILNASLILMWMYFGLSIQLSWFGFSRIFPIIFMLVYIIILIALSVLMFFKWYGYHLLSIWITIYLILVLIARLNSKLIWLIIVSIILALYVISLIINFLIKSKKSNKEVLCNE